VFHVEHFYEKIFMKISGWIVDIENKQIFPGEIYFFGKRIKSIKRVRTCPDQYILPGLVDSHIHIESTMVTPSSFGYEAVKHGTVGVISDPHEIANVIGIDGVDYMIRDSKNSPVHFWFGAPSCVPATIFESSGGKLDTNDIKKLLKDKNIYYLSELMNFPGVVNDDIEVHEKIRLAKEFGKPVDGHAPGLSGVELQKYINAGISTDHECSSLDEALEKISLGMKILIREGSAARNLNSLKSLFRLHPEMIMLCSDDLHPEMLVKGHINVLIARLVSEGYDFYDVLKSATLNPFKHYGIKGGLLKEGNLADFIIVDSPSEMNVYETWIEGNRVFNRGERYFSYVTSDVINNFNSQPISVEDLKIEINKGNLKVIEAIDGELTTKKLLIRLKGNNEIERLKDQDILKIVVKERYNNKAPAVGLIKGFGLKHGAFASSVSHDSHNILAVGTNDDDIVKVINEVVRLKGGMSVSFDNKIFSVPLAIGGIMSDKKVSEIALEYSELDKMVKHLGSGMSAPFMTLSFMALLVIPELKIGDRGLFDVNSFKPVSLFEE
jgi:adenine deaminase